MRQAPVEDLAAVDSMTRPVAERVHAFLQGSLLEKTALLEQGRENLEKEKQE